MRRWMARVFALLLVLSAVLPVQRQAAAALPTAAGLAPGAATTIASLLPQVQGIEPTPTPLAMARALSAPAQRPAIRPEDVRTDALQQAYTLLLDKYVDPPTPTQLLSAAWQGALAEYARVGGLAYPTTPVLSGDRERDWERFRAAYVDLAVRYSTLGDVQQLGFAAASAMAEKLDEGHTHFLLPAQYQEHLEWSRGEMKYAGVGARLRANPLAIAEVFEGSPAAAAGLQPGDIVLAVDGEPTDGLGIEDAIRRVRGPAGSAVTLRVKRGDAPPFDLTIVRAMVSMPFVESRLVDGVWGYIQVRGFPEPATAQEVERRLRELQEQGAQGIVLDLRGNSGGRIDVGTRLLNLFVKEGPLFQEIERDGERTTSAAAGGYWEHPLPLAVLIDEGTASMGEIFAAAVQERGVARLFGTTTSGNVAAAQVFPLADGSALQITIMNILSGDGRTLNGVGVKPDVEVSRSNQDLLEGRDPPLDAAVAYLQEQASARARSSGS